MGNAQKVAIGKKGGKYIMKNANEGMKKESFIWKNICIQ